MSPHLRRNWLEIEQIGQATVAKFTTPHILEEEKIQAIGRQLLRLGQEAGRGSVVLNFATVERLSSEMLGKLLAFHRQVRACGGRLALCAIRPELYQIFRMLKLPQVLTIFADEQEALQRVES
jgi:anti-anti-sigma factor